MRTKSALLTFGLLLTLGTAQATPGTDFTKALLASDEVTMARQLGLNSLTLRQDVPWWFAENDTLLLRGPVDVARSTLREHGPAIAAAWVYSTVARRGLEATYDEEGGEIHSDRLAQKWAEIFLQRYAPGESARLCQFHDERRHAMRLSHILEAVKTLPEALTKQAGLDCERLNATLTQLHADLDESRKHLPRL